MYVLRAGVLAAFLFPTIAFASISIRFESDGVVAAGVTRGGKVIAASFERRPDREQRDANRVLVDDDNDGEVRIKLDERATERSVWVFVDFQSGEYAASMPDGALDQIDFHGGGFKEGNPGQVNRLLHKAGSRLNLVLVRPGEGAWAIRATDGGDRDKDGGHNGTLDVDVADFAPLRDSGPAPKHFGKGDVIVAIDPYSLEVFATKVGK